MGNKSAIRPNKIVVMWDFLTYTIVHACFPAFTRQYFALICCLFVKKLQTFKISLKPGNQLVSLKHTLTYTFMITPFSMSACRWLEVSKIK